MRMQTCTRHLAVLLIFCFITSGCSIKQEVTKLKQKPETVCIVEHTAVRNGVLVALQDGFHKHGIANKVIKGTYENKHNMWNASWETGVTLGCDVVAMYVARWTWDIAMFMYLANIWMTSPDGDRRLGQATYDASGGGARFDKFIDAREKILELVDQLVSAAR